MPPLTEAPVKATPSKILVPPLTVTPLKSVGVEEAETTIVLPPLDGVWKANVSLPNVMAYQVLLLHEEDE